MGRQQAISLTVAGRPATASLASRATRLGSPKALKNDAGMLFSSPSEQHASRGILTGVAIGMIVFLLICVIMQLYSAKSSGVKGIFSNWHYEAPAEPTGEGSGPVEAALEIASPHSGHMPETLPVRL